ASHLGDEADVLHVERRGGYEHLVVVGEGEPRRGERDYEPAREEAAAEKAERADEQPQEDCRGDGPGRKAEKQRRSVPEALRRYELRGRREQPAGGEGRGRGEGERPLRGRAAPCAGKFHGLCLSRRASRSGRKRARRWAGAPAACCRARGR